MAIFSFAEALEIVRVHASALPSRQIEQIWLRDSLGRVLAEAVLADRDQPPFDRSTRDGFAVRAQDWNSGIPLRVVGQIRAGEIWRAGEIQPGCAVEIMTGAPVPAGLDAVGMVEYAECSEGFLTAAPGHTLRVGDNIVARAREARAGDKVLAAGTVMAGAEIAIAAGCGRSQFCVYERATVAIAATGDELVQVEDTPGPHQIRNSNTWGIAALVQAAGAIAAPLPIARDVREDLRQRIAAALGSDLLVLSGGVSAGKYDLVEEVLSEMGAEFLFTGVRMQPGKPVVFGRLPAQESSAEGWAWRYFFGLPGNPVSTQVTFHCFVEPFLRVLGRTAWTGPRFARATLTEDVAARTGMTRVLPAYLTPGFERTEVRLVAWQGSGDLAANARANCYAVIPDGVALGRGDTISVLLR